MDVVARIKGKVSAIQRAMATAAAGVEEIRRAIADLRAERERVASAPVPISAASAALGQMLDRWEAAGQNRYIGIDPIIRAATAGDVPQIEIHQSATRTHSRASGPAVKAAVGSRAEIRGRGALPDVPPGLPADERQLRMAEIDQELLRLESLEEEAIQAAEAGGLQIPRRPDAAVEAVLGLDP
jgi:hypothetical protein